MSSVLHEVVSDEEFDPIWPVLFQAFRNPYNSFSKFFNPVHTTLEEAIRVSKARHIQMWKNDPNFHWVYVTATDTSEVLGAACWGIHERPPPSSPKPFVASWHIEGSDEKAFAERLIGGLREFYTQRMTRPHVVLSQMIVHPEHRSKGIGRLLVQWGKRQADKRGMEMAIESVPFAVPFYEKCGFGCVEQIDIDFNVANPSNQWKMYQKDDLRAFFMWRPAGQDYHAGAKVPWKSS